jgi:hypothetical protein
MGDACDPDDDGDGVPDDGDADGAAPGGFNARPAHTFDCVTGLVAPLPAPPTPAGQCTAGVRSGCDDNCPFVRNADQLDTDGDTNPEDETWAFSPLYAGDEPCDSDDDDDGLPDEDEVACGTDPKRDDSDRDGFSDFVELYPAGAPEAGTADWLDAFCCRGIPDDAAAVACLDRVRASLAATAAARSCATERRYATDPLWDKDTPDHHVPPGSRIGGSCSAGGGASPWWGLVPVLFALGLVRRKGVHA